jgi:hypothetical protein
MTRMPARIADGDRLGPRHQAGVDAHVERRAGDLVEDDDRAGAEAGRQVGDVHADAAELDGDLERDVVEQRLEAADVEGRGAVVVHGRPPPGRARAATSTDKTPRVTIGRPQALSTSPQ